MSNLIAQAPAAGTSQFGTGLLPSDPPTSGLAAFEYSTPISSLENLITNLLGTLTLIGSLIFIFMFIYGAIKWITGGDDSAKVGKARDQMIQGVVGMVIMIASYAIVGLVGTVIGVDILNPAAQINTIFGF